MFEIAEGEGRTFWAATDGSSTYYKGQIVSYLAAGAAVINGTVIPLAVPLTQTSSAAAAGLEKPGSPGSPVPP